MATIFNYSCPPLKILGYAFKEEWLFFKLLLFTANFV